MPQKKLLYDESVLKQVSELLIKRKESVATAESVTAGHIQVALSLAPQALNFFQGGLTTYNLGQKARHLSVDPIFAQECDCVSEQVAASMAVSIHSLFNCDWGIAATGYASPVPEKNIKKLFACFAISYRQNKMLAKTIYCPQAPPFEVCVRYTNAIFEEFTALLRNRKRLSV